MSRPLILYNRMGSRTQMNNSVVGENLVLTDGSDTNYNWTPCKFGNGWENTSEASYVTFPGSDIDSRQGCYEFWHTISSFHGPGDVRCTTLDNFSGLSVGASEYGMIIYHNNQDAPTTRITFGIYYRNGADYLLLHISSAECISAGYTFSEGVTYHFAFVWDVFGGIEGSYVLGVYVDGVFLKGLSQSVSAGSQVQLSTPRDFRIGKNYFNYSTNETMQGPMDNLKIWNIPKADFSQREQERYGLNDTLLVK